MVENIGKCEKTKENFYNLDSFYSLTNTEISKIIMYIEKESGTIIGLEFYYGDLSTGIFCINRYDEKILKSDNDKIIIKEINIIQKETRIIDSIFLENKILKLQFITGNEKLGLNICEYIEGITEIDIEKIIPNITKKKIDLINEKNEYKQIISFDFSFNKDELTYIRPIFKKNEDYIKLENFENIYKTSLYGKKFPDSKEYKLNEIILKDNYNLNKIIFYHDSNIIMGIEMIYNLEDKILNEKFGRTDSGIKTILEINKNKNEIIEEILLRTGDLMDGILIKTNKNKIIIAGGNGGGEHLYKINKSENNKNYTLVGLEGSGAGTIHQIRLILKLI